MASQRRKTTISVGLSPWVIQNLDRSLKDEKYAGQSDLVSIALIEHFIREEIRERDEKLIAIYQMLLQTDEGKKALSGMQIKERDKIEALKKKGIACVELGDLDEAMKCFAKAKELEGSGSKNSKSDEDYPREYILE
ncbi:tetratricopeptide repeat protein [Methanosarcina siciliae]|uniref:tetratricopeptide repeat protein n=1 Tax=Methanosarcina siciliae TaxID=38027 RepID=UPI00064EFC4F|nr:tetratricopeptide repeat protein [Methanosarcina siciliae]